MEANSVVAENAAPVKRPKSFQDLTGQHFGRLTVISLAPDYILPRGKAIIRWNCVCSCEKHTQVSVLAMSLKSGGTQSCGCLKRERVAQSKITHGHTRGPKWSKTYGCYRSMIKRCTSPKHKAFSYYGGRGIRVCARWLESFENFLADMGEPPEGMSIERIDNNGNYELGNCRWATRSEQAHNMRSNRNLTVDGETLCLSEWSRRSGVSNRTIRDRLKRGWDAKCAVFQSRVYGNSP